jgi:4-diphosphocytidyl-2-C-methyl-D-erythritol kinase
VEEKQKSNVHIWKFRMFDLSLPRNSKADKMITFPNSKINIGLNVVNKRPDGYHDIETVFYPVNLQDALEINLMKPLETSSIRKAVERTIGKSVERTIGKSVEGARFIKPFGAGLTPDEKTDNTPYSLSLLGTKFPGEAKDNLVVKAYMMMLEDFILPSIDIHLYKHIPTGAGLGGGSSDCASMIMLLNRRFGLRLTDSCMERYAARLGSDCAFFIKNRPVFATGKGEIMAPIELSLKGYTLLLIKPDVSVNTKEAYDNISIGRPEIPLRDAVKRPIREWKDLIFNDFEKHVFSKYPQIRDIKQKMYDLGALYAAMTGSGSTVYGIFENPLDNPANIFPDMFCRQRELL